jgi:amino acid transporter
VAAGVANALIVLCFGEAGTRFLEARGPYAYARTAFGPLVGFGVAWTMWATCVVSQAALADALALYVGRFLGGAANGFFTVSKLAPLLLFLGFGLFHIEPGNFSGMFDISGGDLGSAVLMLMFAFGGYELITNTGERVTLAAPRALLLTIAIVCALYRLVQLVPPARCRGCQPPRRRLPMLPGSSCAPPSVC